VDSIMDHFWTPGNPDKWLSDHRFRVFSESAACRGQLTWPTIISPTFYGNSERSDKPIPSMMEGSLSHLKPEPPKMPEEENDEDFFRKWTTDAHGNRVMRGLTADETAWCNEYEAKRLRYRTDRRCFPWNSVDEMHDEQDRWRSLHDKHEPARIAAISAEAELRVAKPKLN
jgi:hypothetical protein